ncbi:16S rRNA (adenine(1518)-N(6)/adenine(1519)-N(6))-dimethyltransferase RsmA [Mycoplasma flocculare]|uniref:Ribosomal RNA small subunit methyltransferase A n=2 Tax=Mesomycoplasma flocculare TaxID=2128 RepID=A0A0A8E954_MESFC|nr:16S rRNA (adenine(1518)-N(6)/adenine(1519)-N(6))-dimethyltransferase RsmA [Mesomycoplasma flocculare]MXR39181.1 16S rRNA (adenine(1518)-N(6)/adenine(1519)-N(6))-dimethyltransferase RsmA [Mycoplasma sp. MF12]AJC50112.1 16S ribosomal RNA methyltransferase KsgA/Dim1 family protein [Mesomycoplasma flocculare ATCC 27399]ENX50785.1 dimethyladenosine transferase [Mesomycoplasma flocculare ATCC 27716]MXR06052.1 16S rRNA (adenine(1518)-N(6)/adenine(1519)-N(6))-dimethyltransferase RsmA [Mesomycoplasma
MQKLVPKKHLGQNFLKDKKIAKKIVTNIDFSDKNVIEIGCGTGFLTEFLLKKAKFVTCYEVDKNLIPILERKFENKNIRIINEDFLLANLDFSEKQIIIANLPYYITSKILFKIFDNFEKFGKILLMVQDEVANRIVAQTSTSFYSKLSLASQYVADVQKLFRVSPFSFFPVPKVNSAVVLFKIKENLDCEKIKQFFWFTKMCFQFKRKTLYNNFKFFLSKDQIEKIYNFFQFSQNIRPQEIDLATYIMLTDFYFNNFS